MMMMKKTDDDAKSTDVGVETTGSSDISEQNNLDDTTKNKENKEKTHLRKKKPTNYTKNIIDSDSDIYLHKNKRIDKFIRITRSSYSPQARGPSQIRVFSPPEVGGRNRYNKNTSTNTKRMTIKILIIFHIKTRDYNSGHPSC